MKKFERKVAEVESQILTRNEAGKVRDPQLEQAYQDLENLRDALTQSEENPIERDLVQNRNWHTISRVPCAALIPGQFYEANYPNWFFDNR